MVLAASTYQLDAIQAAKRLGHRVVTLDNVPANPGHALADAAFTDTSTTDIPTVVGIALRERIDGAISPCTDIAVPTVAALAEALGIVGPPVAATAACCDKLAFREFQRRVGLPHPKSVAIGPDDSPPALDFRTPWIVKPDRSSGSKGIFILRNAADLAARLPEARSFSPTRQVGVEQFIDGWQGTVEGIFARGRLAWEAILDRETAPPPFVATTGHRLPSRLHGKLKRRLRYQLTAVWRELALCDGPFDADFVCTADEVYLLEVSPRLGGNGITRLLRHATGLDLAEYAVQAALGQAPDLNVPPPRAASVRILGVPQAGKLAYDAGEAAALRQEPWLAELEFDLPLGTEAPAFQNGRHRVGAAYLVANTREELDDRVAEFHRRLKLTAVGAAPAGSAEGEHG